MVPSKYEFYIGKIKENFAMRIGYISTNGVFTEDSNYRASVITDMPESRYIIMLNTPEYSSTARIAYYDENNTFLGYNNLYEGLHTSTRTNATQYAISYQYNDTAFSTDDYIADLIRVEPHYNKLNKKYSKENGQQFFRESLDGKITLIGQDYEIVANSSIEDSFVFVIIKSNKLYYKGTFSKTDCTFDHVKKQCELKITALDKYNKILAGYENTYDLIKLAPATVQVQLAKRCAIQIYIAGGNTVSTFFNGTYVEDEVDSVIDSDSSLTASYHFALASRYNEMYIDSVPNYSLAKGEFVTDGNRWENQYGYYLELQQVAKAGDGFEGTYAKNDIYNINTGASVSNQQTVGSGETATIVFRYNTYALRLFYPSDVQIAESTLLFYIPDSKAIYFDGFSDIEMNTSAGNKFNITNILLQRIYQRLLCDVDSVSGVSTYNISSNDFAYSSGNYKKVVGLEDYALGNIVYTTVTQIEPTKYGKNDLGLYFTDDFLPAVSGIGRLLPVCRNSWGNTSIWFAYNETIFNAIDVLSRKTYMLNDAYSIASVIIALLQEIDPSIKHSYDSTYSNFLYGSTSINNMSTRLLLVPKSNILKGEYDQAAQKAEITLKDVMDMLAKCFQCYWYIDSDNRFIIEHIYYFNNNLSYIPINTYQIDLTKLKDQFNKKISESFQQEIEYNKSDLAKRYEFTWMDDCTEAFGSVVLDINSKYVQQDKTEEVTASQFSSDVDFMLYKPDNFSSDGFALLATSWNSNTGYSVPIVAVTLLDEKGRTYNTNIQNYYASWSYLAFNYYRYYMPAQYGNINTLGAISASDIIKSMSQEIEFFSEDDPDTLQLIRTSIGNGKIDELSVNITTRLCTATLVYKPQ